MGGVAKDYNKLWAIVAGTILLIAAVFIYRSGFTDPAEDPSTRISAIVLIGLALTVMFMAILAITFSVIGFKNETQPLGLPEGSVRALLAFSLVLIFACLAVYLFSQVNDSNCAHCGKVLNRVSDSDLADLRINFIVAAEQAVDDKGKPLFKQAPNPKQDGTTIDDPAHPLYKVTYYPKQAKDASDFAKQIFTTLATIFVSVVSFYFGSSVTASAVKTGADNVQGAGADKKQIALTNALADSHNAQIAADTAKKDADDAAAALRVDPLDPEKQAANAAALRKLDDAMRDLQARQAAVATAQQTLKPNSA